MGLDIIARAAATAAGNAVSAATAAANAATTAANTATTTANAAQSTATSAQTAATAAQSTANSAQTAANSAQSTANTAATNASTALSTANTAATNASNAQTAANSAASAASAAQSTANSAQTAASTAQTTANSAQSTANTAATNASLALASTAPADLFVNIGSRTIDASITAIKSSGYNALGLGIATYVSDATANAALAAAHPRFCKQTANGRYFRLVPSDPDKSVSVAQGGAVGVVGTNDQPAIQATVAYACATGCKWVTFPETAYELWTPIRTTVVSTHAVDGHPIAITTNDGLGLRGCRGGTTLNLKNSTGGSKNTVTQTVGGVLWQGGGIYVLPGGAVPGGGPVEWVALENLIVDGGVTFNPADRSNTNVYDKGFWLQDIACNRITLRNCTFKNFAGEIYYVGGAQIANQFLENCTFDGSPQSALNPSSNGKFLGINVQAGNSYQACEVIGGLSFTLVNSRLYDFYSSNFSGGPDPSIPAGYPFTYSVRQTTKRPPWVTLIGVRVDGATDGLYIGSWVQGSLITVDARVSLNYFVGYLRDIHLNIEAWADQKSAFAAAELTGPPTTTTQMLSAPVGAYYTPPSNIRLNITCKRTQVAQAASRSFSAGINLAAGLYDKNTITVVVSGDANAVYTVAPSPPAGFAIPRIDVVNFRTTLQPFGGTYDYPAADKLYDVAWSAMTMYPSIAGTFNITLGTTLGYSDGQKVIFYHGDPGAGRTLVFPANGSGLKLQRDRKLYGIGDLLELRYDGTINKWVEERYVPATQQTFTGTVAWDPPNIAAAASTTTTVTVTGAALGDTVTSIWLDISHGGLILTGYVSAANTVTAVLFNPTGAAVNLAATNVNVIVQKK